MSIAATNPSRVPPAPPAPPLPGDSRERELLIQRQLQRTSLHVRLVELAGAVVVWLVGVLVLFLIAAAIDHFVGLGKSGRFVGLAVLIVGSVYVLTTQVVPLLVRAINPAYAARTIEESAPNLKNSLINFLLLRQERATIREIIYQAVEQRAARDIVTVPVESAVDHSRLIYAGYVLCGVMALFAAYKILSPKDPFQTVARVLAPWADIARPSRVQISEIEPGNAEFYHGQVVKVAAKVRGVRDSDKVRVSYSTSDGQLVNREVPMKWTVGDRYECSLPPEDQSASGAAGGLQQDVTYRILAGDAESSAYRLRVLTAPTIIVERLEFQYPAYTKKQPEKVEQKGDIKAIEGTKVTIHALANQPIQSAWIEFDPTRDAAAEVFPLTVEGQQAKGTMTLLLKGDRQTPWHAAYQVRFHNQRLEKSLQPILHKIEVIRDLAPEVQILQPDRMRVEVPQDGEQLIEVRAVDPDYGLSRVRLESAVASKPPLNIDLLEAAGGEPPQVTVRHALRPSDHQLPVGAELHYVAAAEDNRTSPLTGQPEPNVTKTKEYTLVVTPPRGGQQGPGGKGQPSADNKSVAKGNQSNQSSKTAQQPDKADKAGNQKNQQPDAQPEKNQEPKGDPQGKQKQNSGKQSGQQQGKQKSGTKGEQQSGGSSSQTGQQQDGQQQSGQPQDGPKGNEQQTGGQSADSQQSPAGQQQQGNAGAKGSSESKSGPSGEQPQSDSNEGAKAAAPRSKSGGEGQGKAHDGQAIEEVVKDLERRGQSPQQSGEQRNPGENQKGDPREQGNNGATDEKGSKGTKSAESSSEQPQAKGQSGTNGENTPSSGVPEPNDQKIDSRAAGQKAGDKSANPSRQQPDEKMGQNPSQQKSGGNEGGAPRGQSKTDNGEKSPDGKGEKRDSGAGKNGDEGAGAASQDKTGSGDGTRQNRDRNKDMQPDSNKPEEGEKSALSNSRKQSDSKGGQSGDESGGGKQGAGQSAKQEGNDSAGSKSAADQGAGQASEKGSGETGSKGGDQQKANGKTGQAGNEAGEGSAGQPGEKGDQAGSGGKAGPGSPSKSSKEKSQPQDQSKTSGKGSAPVGGADGNRPPPDSTPSTAEAEAADAANLEYARKATEMALQRLKDQEHNPDPELLEKLGWTREDLAEFLRRWENLQRSAGESPTGKRELDEALKSLGLRDPANKKRAGGKASDNQRDLRDAGNRSSAPPKYRELFDAFRKGAARSSP